jgi:hypothetical protein
LFGVAFSPDSKYLLTGSNLWNIARLLAIDRDQLGGLTGRDKLISLGVQRISGTQLNQGKSTETDDECSKLRMMEIPIFKIAEWDDAALVCPFPFLGLPSPIAYRRDAGGVPNTDLEDLLRRDDVSKGGQSAK